MAPAPHKPLPDGTVFGEWTVTGFDRSKSRTSYFVRCSCGFETSARLDQMKSGKSNKCLTCGNSPRIYKSFGEISGVYMTRLTDSAKRRNLLVSITVEDLDRQWRFQQGKCALTGWDLTLKLLDRDFNGNASVDRIDSSKGYEPGNIQWVHKHINNMKLDHEESYFFDLCNAVTAHKDQTKKLREGRPWLLKE